MLTRVNATGKTNSPPNERNMAAAGMIHATDAIARDVLTTAPMPTARARKVAMMGPAQEA